MSYKSRWDNGNWKVVCDVCGREYKNYDLQLRWDGLMVCSGDWEPRQPQDFVHGVADKQTYKKHLLSAYYLTCMYHLEK